MDSQSHSSSPAEKPLVVEDWPMNLGSTREQLKKAQNRMEQYKAALRLANAEIERRTLGIVSLTAFIHKANQTTKPTALQKLALTQALRMTNTSIGAIVLIDTETKALSLNIHKGLTPQLTNILTGHEMGFGAMALMPHLVAGSGALLEYSGNDPLELRLLKAGKLTSLVSLPLQLGPSLVGAFLVGLRDRKSFTPGELYFLMAISQETAIALDILRLRDGLWDTAKTLLGGETINIDLDQVDEPSLELDLSTPFETSAIPSQISQPAEDDLEQLLAAMMEAEEEVQRHNTDLLTLISITETMNRTLNLTKILQQAVEQTQTVVQTDATWLYLVDETNKLDMRAHHNLSDAYIRGMQRLAMGDQIEGKAAAENTVYFIASVAEEMPQHKIWVDRERLNAIAAVPITRPEPEGRVGQTGAHVIGVLATAKRDVKSYVWHPREIRLLNSIANQIALAIDNARLYNQLQEAETGLRVGNEVLRAVNDMLLEKNSFLEGFIRDDLAPALNEVVPVIQQLLVAKPATLTEDQQRGLFGIQEIINRLSSLAAETSDMSVVLDTEFERALGAEHSEDGYTPPKLPPRLEKKSQEASIAQLPIIEGVPDSQPDKVEKKENEVALKSATIDEKNNEIKQQPPRSDNVDNSTEAKPKQPTKAFSFEEAVAAGLVPAHILNREDND